MDIVAELTPSAPLLAVQHAARTLRVGAWARLTGVGTCTDVIAAEPMMADGDSLFPRGFPRGSLLHTLLAVLR